ncbi:MAG: DUF2341 domain-containing protein [Chloroflexi bacterium]|nr:DUF2341 domain-containing protein [Chloroflexota bacterium]
MKLERFLALAGLLCGLLAVSAGIATAMPVSDGGSLRVAVLEPARAAGWAYRRPIHIDNARNAAALSDYPVKVSLDAANFDFGQADDQGDDLRFTDEDGWTLLNHWVEHYDAQQRLATVWVKVPAIPAAATKTIYLYHGNDAPHSISNGMRVFSFFDDFGIPGTGYYALSPARTVLTVTQSWEKAAPHTLSVVEVDRDGYRYWGYYGLTNCGGIGLVRSNDLLHWDKYERNPLYGNGGERWPSVVKVDGTYYMVHDRDYCTRSYLVLRSSKDGLDFGPPDTYTVLIPPEDGARNQNANLFYDPNSRLFYLYWYRGDQHGTWQIKARSAATAEGLADPANERVLIEEPYEIAAPHMLYYDNTYFLATEVNENAWKTRVYQGASATGPFVELPGNPILGDNEACFFQHVFGDTLHAYYCKDTGAGWVLNYRSADLTLGRTSTRILDVSKWAIPGGQWSLVNEGPAGAGQADTGNIVLSSTQTADAVLWSSAFTGTDYTVEVPGRIVAGETWGLGVRASDERNMYRVDLRDQTLSVGRLADGKLTRIAETALDDVDLSAWFTVTVKAHGDALDILVNDKPRLHVTDAQYSTGHVALYGQAGTTAWFDRVLVWKYAANEPTVAVGAAERQAETAGVWFGTVPPGTSTPASTAFVPAQPEMTPTPAAGAAGAGGMSPWVVAGAALAIGVAGGVIWLARRRG